MTAARAVERRDVPDMVQTLDMLRKRSRVIAAENASLRTRLMAAEDAAEDARPAGLGVWLARLGAVFVAGLAAGAWAFGG